MKKNQRQEEINQDQKRTSYSYMAPRKHTNLTSTLDFEWPEFTNETSRIKAYSKRYANMSIVDSFNKEYGSQISEKVEEPQIPIGLKVGDTVKTRIGFNNNGIYLKDVSTKETVICRNNFKRFKNLNVGDDKLLTAEVVDVNKKQVTVDLLKPMFNEWVTPIIKDPDIQCDIHNPKVVYVKDLVLARGGFTGKVSVPTIESVLGEPYYVDAFIPGSQIVLNIENDFEKWVGKTVPAFVTNYITKPNMVNQMSLICSVKKYLSYVGDLNKIEMFDHYCKDDEVWDNITKTTYPGKVTGVIDSSKKCGVFVEIPSLYITGMINLEPSEIVKYNPGQEVFVNITDFEDMTYFDSTTGQRVHLIPYNTDDGVVRDCILKPVLKFA